MERPERKRRRNSRLLYNLVLGVVGLASVVVIVFCLSGIITTLQPSQGTTPPSSDVMQNPSSDPTESTPPVTGSTPPAPTDPGWDVVKVDALIADADFIAAGYDYAKAIEMLKAYEGYEDIAPITEKIAEYEDLDSKLVVYDKPETTTHIFFHSLIVDTNRAFDGDAEEMGYHQSMTTLSEFYAILEEMYDRGFVLVTPYDVAYEVTNPDGTKSFKYGEIRLPEGKKPFIMSQDDLNYYGYMISSAHGKDEIPRFNDENNDGFASRLVIGEDGYPTCEYVDADGNTLYGDYDLVPALESFIREHPDFSYRGARAVLGVTGYEGVLGYRTKPSYKAELDAMYARGEYPWDYATEVQKAKEVAQCLRDHGWIIASHSYGHPAYGNISAGRVNSDSSEWERTVQPVVGDTDIILFPYGSDIGNWKKYEMTNEKFTTLYEHGYRYFFNVDSAVYWNQLGDNYFRGGRRNLDGIRMYDALTDPAKDFVSDLFDVKKVYDDARPGYNPRG